MLYKNKKTKFKWDVTDKSLMKRLDKDPDFERAGKQKDVEKDGAADTPENEA